MKISIKKTVSVNKKELEILDPDSIYINILFYFNKPVFSNSPKSNDKIYLNLSGFYLNENEYIEEIIIPKTKTPIKNLKKTIDTMYNFKNEIQHIKYLFNKQNVYYIIVKLN